MIVIGARKTDESFIFKERKFTMNTEEMLSQRESINKAFKSLIKSGRPDIRDDNNNDIVKELYVDLFEGDYFLQLAMDDNHTIFKGRRGTGKSTVFIQAESCLKEKRNVLPIYINLQTCYEVIRTSDTALNDELNKWNTYKNFFNEVLLAIKNKCKKLFRNNAEIDHLFQAIKEGEYIDAEFQRTLTVIETKEKLHNLNANAAKTDKVVSIGVASDASIKNTIEETHDGKEMRIYSINKILKKLTEILEKQNINKVYLFLDDFSELEKDAQQLIVDSLMAPIISSYNDYFVVKLAAYPYRMYLGNIDSNKIIQYSLDFYDVYEKSASNYKEVENLGIDYVKRTIKKRIEVFTSGQMDADELFDTSKVAIDVYYRTLFYASAGIPRCLGYILDYTYLGSINQGKAINISNIENSAKKYFNENIYPDFYNDVRFKQSFLDDGEILNQISQNKLVNDLIKIAKEFKRNQINQYKSNGAVKAIYSETIIKYKNSNGYWLPSSHFSVEKDVEGLLQTLELYFIVNKFNEGSTRKPGVKMSYYGFNYGMCLEKNIDYGKPDIRRAYDYWRQDEFDYTEIIPKLLKSSNAPKCKSCGYEYKKQDEFDVARRFGFCLNCREVGTLCEEVDVDEVLQQQIEKWRAVGLPDLQMSILRVLYNKRNSNEELTAMNIAGELDIHHAAITKSCDKLNKLNYVRYTIQNVRHYEITQKAINTFFDIEVDEQE